MHGETGRRSQRRPRLTEASFSRIGAATLVVPVSEDSFIEVAYMAPVPKALS